MGTLVVQTPQFNDVYQHVLKFEACTAASQISHMFNAQFVDKSPDITDHTLCIFYK